MFTEEVSLVKLKQYKRVRKSDAKMKRAICKYQFERVNYDLVDRFGNTPLHMATLKNCPRTAELLLRAYACNLEQRNRFG